jgi:hypothetical protein
MNYLRPGSAPGAVPGFLLGLFPLGLIPNHATLPSWILSAVVLGMTTLLGGISASVTLELARRAEARELLPGSEAVGEVGLTEGEARQLTDGRR